MAFETKDKTVEMSSKVAEGALVGSALVKRSVDVESTVLTSIPAPSLKTGSTMSLTRRDCRVDSIGSTEEKADKELEICERVYVMGTEGRATDSTSTSLGSAADRQLFARTMTTSTLRAGFCSCTF